jgi:hypothetical protein
MQRTEAPPFRENMPGLQNSPRRLFVGGSVGTDTPPTLDNFVVRVGRRNFRSGPKIVGSWLPRKIAHIDMDAFYASVEQRLPVFNLFLGKSHQLRFQLMPGNVAGATDTRVIEVRPIHAAPTYFKLWVSSISVLVQK